MKRILLLLIGIVILGVCLVSVTMPGAHTSLTNYAKPDYIKDLVVYKEGDGIVIYFVLADSAMRETAWPGSVTVSIRDGNDESSNPIWLTGFSVMAKDFQRTKVGVGSFERERLICAVGRIKYSEFKHPPREDLGLIKLKFSPQSVMGDLEAEETVFW